MKTKQVGLIGAGNMAGALVRGLLASGTLTKEQLRVSDVRKERLEELAKAHGIVTTLDNRELVAWANLIVLSVKPQVMDRVLDDVGASIRPDTLVVSIAAGVPIKSIESRLHTGVRVVRAMPNTASIVLAGATGIAPGIHATEEDVTVAKTLFDATGRSVVLDESLIDAVTGLSGSGPAYVMLMIEALADGGVKVGLHRDTAMLLAAQTVYGSAKLLLETGEHPGRLKDMVTSPGGTAIAGLHTLEAGGLRRTLAELFGQAHRVHGVDGAHQLHDLLGLVALQVPDHVPAKVGQVRQGGGLLGQLLHVVLAEVPLSRRVGRADRRFRLGLAHRQEAHRARIAPCRARRAFDARVHRRQARGDVVAQLPLRALAITSRYTSRVRSAMRSTPKRRARAVPRALSRSRSAG